MRTAKQVKIGKDNYTIGHWSVDKATEILAFLTMTIGPGVKGIGPLLKEKNLFDTDMSDINLQLDLEFVGIAVTTLSSYVTPEEYSRRMGQILSDDILVNNSPLDYRSHFLGSMKAMHQLALEVIKFQYADFFEDALSRFVGSKARDSPPFDPGPVNINWKIWKPVVRKIATYSEIMEKWNLCDLWDANEALDLQDAADAWYHKQAEAQAEANRRH